MAGGLRGVPGGWSLEFPLEVSHRSSHVSQGKKGPWLVGLFFGDEILPSYIPGLFHKP